MGWRRGRRRSDEPGRRCDSKTGPGQRRRQRSESVARRRCRCRTGAAEREVASRTAARCAAKAAADEREVGVVVVLLRCDRCRALLLCRAPHAPRAAPFARLGSAAGKDSGARWRGAAAPMRLSAAPALGDACSRCRCRHDSRQQRQSNAEQHPSCSGASRCSIRQHGDGCGCCGAQASGSRALSFMRLPHVPLPLVLLLAAPLTDRSSREGGLREGRARGESGSQGRIGVPSLPSDDTSSCYAGSCGCCDSASARVWLSAARQRHGSLSLASCPNAPLAGSSWASQRLHRRQARDSEQQQRRLSSSPLQFANQENASRMQSEDAARWSRDETRQRERPQPHAKAALRW
jgi:hypothetical protein